MKTGFLYNIGILPQYNVPGRSCEYSEQRRNESIRCLLMKKKESVSESVLPRLRAHVCV